MTKPVVPTVEIPTFLLEFDLPESVQKRLKFLRDLQEYGGVLTPDERAEAQGLADTDRWLSRLRHRAQRSLAQQAQKADDT